ncbi:DUF455-domain-containing protein [Lentinula aciculospora]|uniref:DUF455-domain-containing protein n=1 Tax=Lentinula aciculospora TaxID=153920 RepID=A0A9W9AHP2_9AGAR|nr:DUF455-domain-containing protein [Lentinula aciculospora]
MAQVLISPLHNILSHFRFILTLRSEEGKYHGLILFRLSSSPSYVSKDGSTIKVMVENEHDASDRQIYVMEATCPHLGAEMSHADIEEYEDSVVAVCPWHRYDFDLKTGKSETGLRTCTYAVQLKTDPETGEEQVWMQAPEGGRNWRVVELRPVSEEFADPPPETAFLHVTNGMGTPHAQEANEPVVPECNPPKTLMEWAVLILNTPNPTLKVERTRYAVHAFRTGAITSIGHKVAHPPVPPVQPSRETYMNIVEPGKIQSGKRRNRAVMLHALANIEQWAIDLAWDIMARFGPVHKDLPPAFFSDFSKMALDESKHFSLLRARLTAFSVPYGSLPVHASLWDSATLTSRSLLSRLAIIHLVHEARGLDVNPKTIEKFRKAGDKESVDALEVIHADEVTHVTAGHRWFVWMCEQQRQKQDGIELDPIQAFREEVRRCWRGDIKGPFNVEDREKAGLSREFYEDLKGEMPYPDDEGKVNTTSNKVAGKVEAKQGAGQMAQTVENLNREVNIDSVQLASAAVEVAYESGTLSREARGIDRLLVLCQQFQIRRCPYQHQHTRNVHTGPGMPVNKTEMLQSRSRSSTTRNEFWEPDRSHEEISYERVRYMDRWKIGRYTAKRVTHEGAMDILEVLICKDLRGWVGGRLHQWNEC